MQKQHITGHLFRLIFGVTILIFPSTTQTLHSQSPSLQKISSEDADQLRELASLGQGTPYQVAFSGASKVFGVVTSTGVWLYKTTDLNAPAIQLKLTEIRHPYSLAFSRDLLVVGYGSLPSKTVVGGTPSPEDDRLIFWDYQNRTQVRSCATKDLPQLIVPSPDGKMLAYANHGTTLHVIEASTCNEIAVLADLGFQIAAQFSPDSTKLAESSEQGGLSVWDVHLKTKFAHWDGDLQHNVAPVFASDGNTLEIPGYGEVIQWNFETGTHQSFLKNQYLRTIDRMAGTDKYLAVRYTDGEMRIWNLLTGEQLSSPPEAKHDKETDFHIWDGLAWSPDSSFLATSSFEEVSLSIWQQQTQSSIDLSSELSGSYYGLAFSPDDSNLAVSGSARSLQLWDMSTWRVVRAVGTGADEHSAGPAYNMDGTSLVYPLGSEYQFLDSSEKPLHNLAPVTRTDAAISPDGRLLAFSIGMGMFGPMDLIIPAIPQKIHGITFLPMRPMPSIGRAASILDHGLVLWNLYNQQIEKKLGHEGAIAVAFSPDSKLVVTSFQNDYSLVWNTRKYTSDMPFQEHFSALAFSPDGSILIATTVGTEVGQSLSIWRTADWSRRFEVVLPPAQTSTIAVNHSGTLIAFAGNDGVIHLWGIPARQ